VGFGSQIIRKHYSDADAEERPEVFMDRVNASSQA
jgi:hypothetical protein